MPSGPVTASSCSSQGSLRPGSGASRPTTEDDVNNDKGISENGDAGARPRVLILGGGFAGVGAAQKLKKADAEIVVVDRNDYHTFQPLLYQLATCELEMTAVGHSLRDLVGHQHNTRVHESTVTGVDLDAREVTFDGLPTMTYDFLVFGLGAQVNFFGTEGAAEHAFPMYTLANAVSLRDHLLER